MPTKTTNRLIKEKSPYLLQHAHNPVDWYPWGEEAFAKAKKENKPIFLSIGYSTCHWCHVMERESFEDPEIARIMNEYFVAIKVDREERPDLDSIYMNAVMSMTGSGGWPLSAFLTPDKKPFYGGTYFPPVARWGSPGFKDLLLAIHDNWLRQADKIRESSATMTTMLKERIGAKGGGKENPDKKIFQSAYRELAESFDPQHGGFGHAPKFPMGHNLSFLLRYWHRSKEKHALEMVEKTLTEMAGGGMYDQLGGGFHRYSTDAEWQVPHFEKMLYDQAILSKAYLEAYQATHEEKYARIVREIFDYVLREMQDQNGGFLSAEDADSLEAHDGKSNEKKEGAFYIWRAEEIEKALAKEEAGVFEYYFGVEKNGNAHYDPHGEFVGKNILYVAHSVEETARHFQKSVSETQSLLENAKKKLFALRQKRPRPHLDDKVLVDWNGLMISSLAMGASVLNEPKYKVAAARAARFILGSLRRKDGRLLHRYRDGESGIVGTLEDYAFFVHGLIDLYMTAFDPTYLREALRLSEGMVQLFGDPSSNAGLFLTGHDSEQLIWRQKEIYDGALPSGNAIAALDLIRIYHFTFDAKWRERADGILRDFSQEIAQRPSGYTQVLIAFDFIQGPAQEFVIAAEKTTDAVQKILPEIHRRFIPNKVIVLRIVSDKKDQELRSLVPFLDAQVPVGGKPTIYVCENSVCQRPVMELEEFERMLKEH